jgi:hypothetical protein
MRSARRFRVSNSTFKVMKLRNEPNSARIADFQNSRFEIGTIGGHRPPLQVFAKRSHSAFASFVSFCLTGKRAEIGGIRLNPTFEIFRAVT